MLRIATELSKNLKGRCPYDEESRLFSAVFIPCPLVLRRGTGFHSCHDPVGVRLSVTRSESYPTKDRPARLPRNHRPPRPRFGFDRRRHGLPHVDVTSIAVDSCVDCGLASIVATFVLVNLASTESARLHWVAGSEAYSPTPQ